MHPDLEQLQRYLHGELSTARAVLIREHLGTCATCNAQYREFEREEAEVNGLLQQLDHAAHRTSAEQIAAAARRRSFRYRRAAIVLLGLGLGGAVLALPASPLRDWFRSLGDSAADSTPSITPHSLSTLNDQAGIDVDPGRELVIDFVQPQPEGTVIVSLTDGDSVVIRSPSGAARFTADPDRVVIDNTGGAVTFQIQLPRGAARIEIRVAGQRTFLKRNDSITASRAIDAAGRYVLPLRER